MRSLTAAQYSVWGVFGSLYYSSTLNFNNYNELITIKLLIIIYKQLVNLNPDTI